MSSPQLRCLTPYFELFSRDDVVHVRRTARPFASHVEVHAAAGRILTALEPTVRPERMLLDLRRKSAESDRGFEAGLSAHRRSLVQRAEQVAVVTDLDYVRQSLHALPEGEAPRLQIFEDEASALDWLGVKSSSAA